MHLLDVRTIVLTFLASAALCTVLIAMAWQAHRRRFEGLGLWLADFLLQTSMLGLIALRGQIPDLLSIVIANSLGITGTALLCIGLARFAGEQPRSWRQLLFVPAFIAVESHFTYVVPSLAARNVCVSAATLLLCTQAAHLLLYRVAPELRAAARPPALVLLAYAIVSLVRIGLNLGERRGNDFFRDTTGSDALIILVITLLFVALTFSLVLMVSRRLAAEAEQRHAQSLQAEADLRRSRERYQSFIAHSSEAIYRTELDEPVDISLPVEQQIDAIYDNAWIGECNQAMAAMYGLDSPEDLVGRRVRELHGGRDNPTNRAVFRRFVEAGYRTIGSETEERLPDGSQRFYRSNDIGIVEDGRLLRTWGIRVDVTERRQAERERERLQSQLLQAQKMEAIGQLAGGIAHDFNNILAAMTLELTMLRDDAETTPERLREVVDELLAATARAAGLTRQMLLFSRRQALQQTRFDLNVVVQEIARMLHRVLEEPVVLELDCSRQPLWVDGDAGMIGQVVMNLCVNARDAMPGGGRLGVSTALVPLSPELAARHHAVPDADHVCLRVVDAGQGMDRSVLERLFEPFFTTKAQGKGTGLGLATVHGIVGRHGGFVEVESQVGCGSTFSVFLPAAASPPEVDTVPTDVGTTGGSERILVVEDEGLVRRAAVRCLRGLGYRVTEAGDGLEALRVWHRQQGAFDLLLTDMVMPQGLSGLELASRLRRSKPGLRTIISSGYSEQALESDTIRARGIVLLPKPYTSSALAAAVRACLEHPDAPAC